MILRRPKFLSALNQTWVVIRSSGSMISVLLAELYLLRSLLLLLGVIHLAPEEYLTSKSGWMLHVVNEVTESSWNLLSVAVWVNITPLEQPVTCVSLQVFVSFSPPQNDQHAHLFPGKILEKYCVNFTVLTQPCVSWLFSESANDFYQTFGPRCVAHSSTAPLLLLLWLAES